MTKIAMALWHLTDVDTERTGGLERCALTEAELLSSSDVQVRVVARQFRGPTRGYAAQRITPPALLGSRASLGYYALFVLHNVFADVYHAHNSPFVAALRPTKTLVHLNNEVRFPGYDRLQGRYRKAHYACCSDYIRSWLLDTYSGLDESRVHTLYNAADITRFHPSDERDCVNHPPRLLFAGQWDERKGIFILLEAASLLEERGAEFELWIAGSAGLWKSDSDKARADEIEARVRNRADALANVRIVGLVNHDKMADLYRSVDIMVIPSIWDEPSALTFSESMASGLPVIAFPVGGNSEMVLDGETGFLIEEQTPDALAEAIAFLLDRPEKIRRMGQAARARAETQFSWQVHMKRLARLYQTVSPALRSSKLLRAFEAE